MHPKTYRLKHKIPVEKMAADLRLTPRAIYQHESGARRPRPEVIERYKTVSSGEITAVDFQAIALMKMNETCVGS